MITDLLPGESLKACIQSERQLLGCLLHRPDFIHEVTGIVSGTSFSDRSYAVLFDVIAATVARGLQIDSHTIATMVLGQTGGHEVDLILQAVLEIKHEVANAANIVFYARQVAGWHAMRSVRNIGLRLMSQTEDCIEPPDPMVLLANATKAIEEANVVRQDDVLDAGQLADIALIDIDRAMERQTSSGHDTGLVAIDTRWGGIHDGELTLLAARPSLGKTALALSITCSMAEAGKSIFFASLEMTKQQVGLRLLSRMSGIPCDRLKMGYTLSIQERSRLGDAKQKLQSWPIRVWCASGVTVHEIASKARLHSTQMGLDAVFIDYLGQGKIKPMKRHGTANDAITEIVGDIATFTKQINKPVVCLCQLNRGAEGEEPGLQHLRDSGSLEQDADVIWFIHRKRDDPQTKLLVRKCRNGETGEADIVFNADRATFYDAAPSYVNEYAGDFACLNTNQGG
jgi:replicative DNA helicase